MGKCWVRSPDICWRYLPRFKQTAEKIPKYHSLYYIFSSLADLNKIGFLSRLLLM